MSLGGISKSKLLLGLAEIQTCRLLLFYVKDFMNHEQKGLLLNSCGSFDTELYCSHTQVSVFCICDPFSEVLVVLCIVTQWSLTHIYHWLSFTFK